MKYDNQLRYAVHIVNQYDGSIPLSDWLKDFFRKNKQMGSRDRKTVSGMVYAFYRLGHLPFESVEQRILMAIDKIDNLPEVNEYFLSSRQNEALEQETEFDLSGLFPWQHQLSERIDKEALTASFLIQPDLFLRVRPGEKDIVIEKLKNNNIDHTIYDEDCIALRNGTKVEGILEINKEVVVQDRSSQKTGSYLKEVVGLVKDDSKERIEVWDCCAASGGKSIMAYDLVPGIQLTVSDKRESILHNLHRRFMEAGIKNYTAFPADLTSNKTSINSSAYDLVIADVPCSGSGTWARTPEQLYFFEEEKIEYYSKLQKSILNNVIPSMKKGSALLYITCSVFRKENEEVIEYVTSTFGIKLIKMGMITGYHDKADSLFAAVVTAQSV